MTKSVDKKETKSFYTDSNRNVVCKLPIGNTELKLRPPTARDLSCLAAAFEHGLNGELIGTFEKTLYICARLLTPVEELKKDPDAWRSRFESLNGYDIDAEDVNVVVQAVATFRGIRAAVVDIE